MGYNQPYGISPLPGHDAQAVHLAPLNRPFSMRSCAVYAS